MKQFESGKTYTYKTHYDEYIMDFATESCKCIKRTKCFVWLENKRGEVSKRKIQNWSKDCETCDAPGYCGNLFTVYAI